MTPQRENDLFDLAYGRRYGLRMIRLYTHIITLSTFIELLGASTAVAALVGNSPQTSAWAAAMVALATIGRRALRPEEQRARCIILNDRYVRALATERALSDDALHQTVQELQSSDAPDIEALRNPVWNDVVQEMGYFKTAPCELTLKERSISFMA